jgi:hypothetical protein
MNTTVDSGRPDGIRFRHSLGGSSLAVDGLVSAGSAAAVRAVRTAVKKLPVSRTAARAVNAASLPCEIGIPS